ncbi:MAG TPA: hypothetical protein VFD26_08730, partial [Methyloceanibacter sp.]|nr:hypothetical protein [Methyloceanibacter sp.]
LVAPLGQLFLSTAHALFECHLSRRALLYTLEQSPWRGVVLAEVLAWLRFPAVHANVQGGIEYLEARLSPRMPGFFYLVLLRTNSAKTFFAAFSSNQVAYAHDLHFR